VSWFSRKPPPPEIPPYKPVERSEIKPLPKPKDEGIVVEEIDTSAMTRTGVHRAWDRMTGKFK
jgi:hypothetical protein